MKRFFTRIVLLLTVIAAGAMTASAAQKLTGTPIGTERGWEYESYTVVSKMYNNLFDGNLNTYFATEARSYTWGGLDLGTPHVITRIGFCPNNSDVYAQRMVCGVFQGANSADFLDAVPIYIVTELPKRGQMNYVDVNCSRGFRYVRYVATSDSRLNVAELEFYGEAGAGDDSKMYQLTNIPTVCVNTVNSQEPFDKETDITGNFIIINNNTIDTDKAGTVRERGNGSRTFPKKPWRLKFDKKQRVLDAPAKAKKWTLVNNYGDKTLMRNIVAFDIARRMGMKYIPYCQPVDVILNGEFKGCYQLSDQVDVDGDRVAITEMLPTDIEGEALTGGYLWELDAYADQEPAGEWFRSSRGIPVTIKSPDPGITSQYNYVKNYFQNFEDLVFNYYLFSDLTKGYRSLLDINSFIQHFCVGELTANTDTYWSVYQYKERNDPKIYTGPIWDVDLGFENDGRTYPVSTMTGYLYSSGRASIANGVGALVSRIVSSDPNTAKDITRVWSLARNDRGLNADNLCALIDSMAQVLDQSQTLNFKRWNIMNTKVHQNPRILGSYKAECEAVKTFLRGRFTKLDSWMKYDPTLTGIEEIGGDATVRTPLADLLKVENRCIALDGVTPFTVVSVGGIQVYSGSGVTHQLTPGVYIVVCGGERAKIAL